jgi:cation transport regulator ChaC
VSRIALLGWGSLLWDPDPRFDVWHEEWQFDGPAVKIEFSRVSAKRARALTLVLDSQNGRQCTVAYALSRRRTLDDAIADLRCREQTTIANIGVFSSEG